MDFWIKDFYKILDDKNCVKLKLNSKYFIKAKVKDWKYLYYDNKIKLNPYT